MALFSYIVTADSGFSPNPFHGYCTLACCKPAIRRTAAIGDWIAGLTPKRYGHKLIYAMRVEEAISFADYWNNPRFSKKRPDFNSKNGIIGDNIYEPLDEEGKFKQHRSRHSEVNPAYPVGTPERYAEGENTLHKNRDLSGKRVLVSKDFSYFGTHMARKLPKGLRIELVVGRGHRKLTSPQLLASWQAYVEQLPPGVQGIGNSGKCISTECNKTRNKNKNRVC